MLICTGFSVSGYSYPYWKFAVGILLIYLFILLDSLVILFYVSVCISTGTHAATGSSDPSFLYCEKNGFTESLVRRFIFLFMFFYVSLFKSRCGLKYGLFWRLALFLREMAVVLLYSPIFCEVFILFNMTKYQKRRIPGLNMG